MQKLIILIAIIIVIVGLTITVNAVNTNGYVNGYQVRFRAGPSLTADTYDFLNAGDSLYIHGACGDWYEVEYGGKTGYIYKDYVVFERPEIYQLSASSQDGVSVVMNPITVSNQSKSIVDIAKNYLGTPYIWGGETPDGFDCSGFVQYVFNEYGIEIGRTTYEQARDGYSVDLIQEGDILCFGSNQDNIYHTGIYIGNSQFIHSSYGEGVIISRLDNFNLTLIMIRRVL